MRFFYLLPSVLAAIGFSYSASADQCKAVQARQAISFQAISKTVKLKEGAVIMDQLGGKSLFRLRRTGAVRASGVSKDGCWWEIILPNSTVGYVSTNFMRIPGT
jgi:hypothetical protein